MPNPSTLIVRVVHKLVGVYWRLVGIIRRSATRHIIERVKSLFARYVAGHDVHLIEDGLYLGSVAAAQNTSQLLAKGIGAVVTILAKPDLLHADRLKCHGVRNLVVKARDDDKQSFLQVLPEVIAFISSAHEEGSAVLVHCRAGMSRSAALVAGYLMCRHGLSVAEGIARIQVKRTFINPGTGFMKQLSVLEMLVAEGVEQDTLEDLLRSHVDPSLTVPEIVYPR